MAEGSSDLPQSSSHSKLGADLLSTALRGSLQGFGVLIQGVEINLDCIGWR